MERHWRAGRRCGPRHRPPRDIRFNRCGSLAALTDVLHAVVDADTSSLFFPSRGDERSCLGAFVFESGGQLKPTEFHPRPRKGDSQLVALTGNEALGHVGDRHATGRNVQVGVKVTRATRIFSEPPRESRWRAFGVTMQTCLAPSCATGGPRRQHHRQCEQNHSDHLTPPNERELGCYRAQLSSRSVYCLPAK